MLRLVDVDPRVFFGTLTAVRLLRRQTILSLASVSFDMEPEVCLSDVTSCPVEWQPSEAAFSARTFAAVGT